LGLGIVLKQKLTFDSLKSGTKDRINQKYWSTDDNYRCNYFYFVSNQHFSQYSQILFGVCVRIEKCSYIPNYSFLDDRPFCVTWSEDNIVSTANRYWVGYRMDRVGCKIFVVQTICLHNDLLENYCVRFESVSLEGIYQWKYS
jgi:hypothetical protein